MTINSNKGYRFPNVFQVPLSFINHIDKKYFFGYEQNNNILIAGKEKSIIDTLFFASFGRTVFNREELIFDDVDFDNLKNLALKIKSPVFHNMLRKILQ